MSTWNHAWAEPYLAVVREEGKKPLHVPRQQCLRCRAERNPISGGIAAWGYGTECKDNPTEQRTTEWPKQIDYIKEQLHHLKADGQRVDSHHTGMPARG